MSTKPLAGSDAFKAYYRGREANRTNGSLNDNPYKSRKVIGLSNWWIKGFNNIPL